MEALHSPHGNHIPWNKGKLTGQKPPLKLSEIWAIRTRLQIQVTDNNSAPSRSVPYELSIAQSQLPSAPFLKTYVARLVVATAAPAASSELSTVSIITRAVSPFSSTTDSP